MSVVLMIVADDYRMAREYARAHGAGWEGRDWIYCDRPSQVTGRRDGEFVIVTTGGRMCRASLDVRREVVELLRRAGFTERTH